MTAISVGLVLRAKRGDGVAFDQLVSPLLPQATGTALLITRKVHDAEDAVQEALVLAWRDLPTVRDPEAFPAWFRRLVIRSAVRSATRTRRRRATEITEVAVAGGIDRAQQKMELHAAFDSLTPDDRAVVVLRYYLGYSTQDAAAALGIPTGTVKSRLHAAIRRLRVAEMGGSQ